MIKALRRRRRLMTKPRGPYKTRPPDTVIVVKLFGVSLDEMEKAENLIKDALQKADYHGKIFSEMTGNNLLIHQAKGN
jgi:hypothetical protein